MINVNDEGVHIEGNMEELIKEWIFITKDLYKEIARKNELKGTSKLFVKLLETATGAAAIELKLEGKLPEEGDTE